jgi:hypothetical protein
MNPQDHHHHGHRRMSSAEAKAFIDAFAEELFTHVLGAPQGSWKKTPFNRAHRLSVDDKLIDESILEGHDAWLCVFALTRDDQEIYVPMQVVRVHHAGRPRGAVEFAGVWCNDPHDTKGYAAFVDAVAASIDAKYKAMNGPPLPPKFARLSTDLKDVLAKVAEEADEAVRRGEA